MHYLLVLLLAVSFVVIASENPADGYLYRDYCPEGESVTYEQQAVTFPGGAVDGGWFNYLMTDAKGSWKDKSYFVDKWNLAQCNCTSYVASKLNTDWGNTNPQFSRSYYGRTWGNASTWFNAAYASQIGITGARDRFTFDRDRLNGAFRGDIAVWDAWGEIRDGSGKVIRKANPYGHVAYVEADGEPDGTSGGVRCVQISDYNWTAFDYRSRRVCKSTDQDDVNFPHYFIHITQDRTYCLANPTVGSCKSLLAGRVVADGPGDKGVFGGMVPPSDLFNLKLNRFWTRDIATGLDIDSDIGSVRTGQAISVRLQVKAVNGDTHDHMRDGKDTIELDFYAREDLGEWYFLKREYIQATNLPNDATHTEHVDYIVPAGVSEVSFKVKVDAEDEAREANEGDNDSPIITLPINNNPTYDLTITSAGITTGTPVYVGDLMGAKFRILNIGNATPPMATRSCYDIYGPGTSGLWQTIASDQSDGGTLVPGVEQEEEIHSLVPAPTVPGSYTLRITANCSGGIPETNYDNNSLAIPFEVAVVPPRLSIIRFEDKVGCCTTNTGAAPKPRIWVKNDGAQPTSNVLVRYDVSSPIGTGGTFQLMGYGTIEPRELAPGDTDEDQMDCDGCWRIPKSSAWKKQWHTFRACLRQDGSFPIGNPATEVCATYGRYSKE